MQLVMKLADVKIGGRIDGQRIVDKDGPLVRTTYSGLTQYSRVWVEQTVPNSTEYVMLTELASESGSRWEEAPDVEPKSTGKPMGVAKSRLTWFTWEAEDKQNPGYLKIESCGCKMQGCSKCLGFKPIGCKIELVCGTKVGVSFQHGSVTVEAPGADQLNKAGCKTGERIKGEVWHGSLAEFSRNYGKKFVELVMGEAISLMAERGGA